MSVVMPHNCEWNVWIKEHDTEIIHEFISWLQETRKVDIRLWEVLDDFADEYIKEQT